MSGEAALTNNFSTSRKRRAKSGSPSVPIGISADTVVLSDTGNAVDRKSQHRDETGGINHRKGPQELVNEMIHPATLARRA